MTSKFIHFYSEDDDFRIFNNKFRFFRHIQEDLTGIHVHHKDVSDMSDDEKSFYYFKVHDSDNNNNLDGLEMIKAAIHSRHDENFDFQEEFKHIESRFNM